MNLFQQIAQEDRKAMRYPIKNGGPAFPIPAEPGFPTDCGMTLRDYFAGQALQGMLACPEGYCQKIKVNAARSYDVADAMIAAREGKEGA